MKNIKDILKKKKMFSTDGVGKKVLDEKTVERVFLEAAKEEIKNLGDADIREIKLRNNILCVKTTHPVVSSELYLRRRAIVEKANKIVGGEAIERIVLR